MKNKLLLLVLFSLLFALGSCKKTTQLPSKANSVATNERIQYASCLSILTQKGYTVVTIKNPWPKAQHHFKYVLQEKNGNIPDSLQNYPIIPVPLQSIVVTSTTNVPFLEMLGVEKKLLGFPHTDYISSKKTRQLIDQGKVKNVGQNETLNTELLIDLNPDLIVAFGIDNSNPTIDNLQKSGLKVLIQADWMEQTPLGKAEWIKLYGALFGKEKEAAAQFQYIEKSYQETLQLVASKKENPTVLYGSMYQDQWFVAKGESWVAQFLKDAQTHYLWKDTNGTGSLALPFEKVLEKAQKAQFWIATGSFHSLAEMKQANPHYSQFEAFKTKNIYTFESKIGPKGGNIYYEVSTSRPDLVLKDYIKIFHPELLPKYLFTFADKLQ
ncbi:ABC transporter substrate-binding protein [Flavobacterium sp. RSSA_27]|uniref:ABC transporter substrate-binding protein n=1 Tax=Flavobacterium sp. RSSA_27 TaxID=3447667 RepID=UPI003F2DF937